VLVKYSVGERVSKSCKIISESTKRCDHCYGSSDVFRCDLYGECGRSSTQVIVLRNRQFAALCNQCLRMGIWEDFGIDQVALEHLFNLQHGCGYFD
jgi:hypothetical protein